MELGPQQSFVGLDIDDLQWCFPLLSDEAGVPEHDAGVAGAGLRGPTGDQVAVGVPGGPQVARQVGSLGPPKGDRPHRIEGKPDVQQGQLVIHFGLGHQERRWVAGVCEELCDAVVEPAVREDLARAQVAADETAVVAARPDVAGVQLLGDRVDRRGVALVDWSCFELKAIVIDVPQPESFVISTSYKHGSI